MHPCATLKDMWSNTILVFGSDNGGDPTVGANAPYKGGKATLFEGGIRSATFVYSELLPAAVRGCGAFWLQHVFLLEGCYMYWHVV
jgi:arylsulfatase A-like enzyme